MGLQSSDGSDARFSRYVEGLASVIGHADRVNPLRDYCTGLMLPCERKSVEPMAAVTAPGRTAAQHQSLLHFVGQASWSDDHVLAKVCETVLPAPAMQRHGLIDLPIYPEHRLCAHPATEQILAMFSMAERHKLTQDGKIMQVFDVQFTDLQRQLLALLSVPELAFRPPE